MSKRPLLSRSPDKTDVNSYAAASKFRSHARSSSRDTSGIDSDDIRGRRGRSVHDWRSDTVGTGAETFRLSTSRKKLRSDGSSKSVTRAASESVYSDMDVDPDLELKERRKRKHGSLPSRSVGLLDGSSSPKNGEEDASNLYEGQDEEAIGAIPSNDSPYAQVLASVPATDDIRQSISTPRMWILSLFFALIGSATNLFFSLRYPSVFITPVIALILVHPLGKLWDIVLKRPGDHEEIYHLGVRQSHPTNASPSSSSTISSSPLSSKSSLRLWLAQGRWNEKEHACVYVSSNVSFGFAFATDVIVEQHKFYKQDVPLLYQIMLTLSTQILGYAFAGLTRRYLVRPTAMTWPGVLMPASMFNTLHKQENEPADGWTISRYRFFLWVWAAGIAWYFLPGLLFPALSYFNVITWFAPRNVVVANLFGVSSGLGLFPMTFDWAQIAYIGSPLLTPWWAAANIVGGLVLVMWILAPALYYTNVWFSAYLPILSSAVFDNTGKHYDVSKILTSDFRFDETAYQKYSRVYLPITYVLSYGVQFAALSSLLSHTACWHGADIWRQSKDAWQERGSSSSSFGSKGDYHPIHTADDLDHDRRLHSTSGGPKRGHTNESGEDKHSRLMRQYPDVPTYWYLLTLVVMLTMSIVVVEYYHVQLPWYGVLLALSVAATLFIPVGIVMAITNQHCSLYLVSQLMAGWIFSGRPVANMVFVMYSYITTAQGVKFSSDLKLGHYMKIPPRLLFNVQMASTVVSSLTQIATLNLMFAHVPNLCEEDASNSLSCPLARVHFNGSILWGVVGPARFFGKDALYRALIWAFPFGAVAPIVLWLLHRRFNRQRPLSRRRSRNYASSSSSSSSRASSSSSSNNNNINNQNLDDDRSQADNHHHHHHQHQHQNLRLLNLNLLYSSIQYINLPILLGSLSWIPPATGLNFSTWSLTCLFFNFFLRRRRPAWWAKYTMTLSAALDSGLAFGVLIVFFASSVFWFALVAFWDYWGFSHSGGNGGIKWWGTEVYKQGCDWDACSFLQRRSKND